MRWAVFALIFLLSPSVLADVSQKLNIKTQDATVNTYPWQLRVTNGSLTDNGDGTASLTTGGGGSVTTCGTSPVGIQFVDVNSCAWCETINTSGVLTTALLSCPSSGAILMEDGTYILQEDGTKILVE